ncbi:hypothetical protein MN608_04172 [Microdochium nivale]|nr:hypothetical protein MN608_04172 [Microdochium nivale]
MRPAKHCDAEHTPRFPQRPAPFCVQSCAANTGGMEGHEAVGKINQTASPNTQWKNWLKYPVYFAHRLEVPSTKQNCLPPRSLPVCLLHTLMSVMNFEIVAGQTRIGQVNTDRWHPSKQLEPASTGSNEL